MKRFSVILPLVVCVACVSVCWSETCQLELKYLDPSVEQKEGEDNLGFLRMVSSQGCYWQFKDGAVYKERSQEEKDFEALIKKQPNYKTKMPLHGVATFGSSKFVFAFDSTNFEENGFDVLYFDSNLNQDLTDDAPIKAGPMEGNFDSNYKGRQFPMTKVTIQCADKRLDYAFTPRAFSNIDQKTSKISHAGGGFSPAAYREGKITIDGKDHRIFLVDYDANGLFNNVMNAPMANTYEGGRLSAMSGDQVFIDPDLKSAALGGNGPVSRKDCHYLSKMFFWGGKYYNVDITPTGDTLTLTASTDDIGYVKNPNVGFSAVVYGEKGFLLIRSDGSKGVPLPVGEWKLLEYRIDKTEYPKKKAEDEQPKYTYVNASATDKFTPVVVKKAETVTFPFGPPYTPNVKVSTSPDLKAARLSLSITGSQGEHCTDLMVNGEKPEPPLFVISTKEGKLVQRGTFEYG